MGCFTETNFSVFISTAMPCGTGCSVDVSPLYDTVIGTSATERPLFEIFSKISVDTDIPVSVGWMESIALLEYDLKPDWASLTLKSAPKFAADVIILIPLFLYPGVPDLSSKNLEPI